MNIESQRALAQQTSAFYTHHSASFSATRQHAWNGWQTCATHILSDLTPAEKDSAQSHFSVCDIACGNLRLAAFLESLAEAPEEDASAESAHLHTSRIDYTGVDTCMDLCARASATHDARMHICTQECDLIEALLTHTPLVDIDASNKTGASGFDIVSCMGFFHHVPGKQTRKDLLQQLVDIARPGGYIACSLWAFLRDERIAAQAQRVTAAKLEDEEFAAAIELEDNDYLLGWKGDTSRVRYCHHFDDEELSELIGHVQGQTKLVACFDADGKAGNLNHYLIFKKLA